jgi:hypothetical protein
MPGEEPFGPFAPPPPPPPTAVVTPVNDELDPAFPLLYPAPEVDPPAPTVAV